MSTRLHGTGRKLRAQPIWKLRQAANLLFRTNPSPIVSDEQMIKALYLVLPDGRALPGFEAYRSRIWICLRPSKAKNHAIDRLQKQQAPS
jgi:hypothetical protein